MDVREFQEKLKKMQELAKEQGGSLRAEQIREEFSGSDLNSSQLVNVLKYLTGQGILIEGIETETEGSDAQSGTGKPQGFYCTVDVGLFEKLIRKDEV